MKRNTKYLTIFILCVAFVGITIPLSLVIFNRTTASTQSTHILIYVNSTIHSQISSEITQYRQDLMNQNYTADIVSWSDKNVVNLKNHLINASQQLQGLYGAVLIGELPFAYVENNDLYYGLEVFPSDLYLMDLDGFWDNADGDLDFETHVNGNGDLYPEIWIGRINPEILNNINHLTAYQNYFNRNHAYRNGTLTRPHKQLVYIDDDWSFWYNEWLGDMTAYSNITAVYNNATTTAGDYMNKLTQDYEFVHLFVHSYYYQHQFGQGGTGSEGIVTNTNILNLNTQPLFYNLYACSACRISAPNNLGTQYLFSNNTLAVVGSTKPGGMTMNSYFYNPLNQGKIIGEALRLWFLNPLHGPTDPASMGMVLLGDPLLTIQM